jgi:O-antigen/teichoic acid export membrane protein
MFGYVWSLVFTLIITPIIVFTLGVKDYGVYLFITSAMSLFSVLDLGVGIAVSKHMAFYFGKNDMDSVKRLVHTGNLIFFVTGILGLLFSVIVAYVGFSILPASFAAYEQYINLFIFAGGIFFFNVIIASYASILFALQRFDISNIIGVVLTATSSLTMLFVVRMGWSLQGIFISQLLLAMMYALVIFFTAKKLLPIATLEFHWHKKEFLECYTFGFASSINTLANTALSSLDKLIIPFFVGPSNLTYYNMPGSVATKIPGITNAISISLLPTAAELSGSDEIHKMKTFYIRMFRVIIIIAGALTVTSISFSYQILQFWLSTEFAEKSSTVLIILALTNFILALFGPLSSLLLGLNKLKFITMSSLGMAVLNAIFLFILLPPYGITGAALAYLISVLPVFYLFYYVETRYLQLPNRKNHYIKTVLGTLITAVIVGILNFFISQFIMNLVTLLIAGGVSMIAYVIVYRLLGFFEAEDWRDIENFLTYIIKKIN